MRLCRSPNLFSSLLFSAIACLPCSAANARESPPTIHLASLEWLPYVGHDLMQGGVSSVVASSAARQFGYTVKIDYFPWKRAMKVGGEDIGFSGYFPAYYTEERARLCYFSAPMGSSTVGLAYLKNKPLQWRTAEDLAGMKIGVVAGYSNGDAFDALVKQGKLHVDASPGDVFNLKKLLISRVDVVVIDKSVLRYLLATDTELSKEREQIAFHDNILAELSLHVCFQRKPSGLKLQQAFDAALQHLDIRKIENTYFQELENQKKSAFK